MTRTPAALAAFALLLPLAGVAAEPRYTYVEGGYRHLDIDGGRIDADGDGFALGGSLMLSDRVFLEAAYSNLDLDFGIDVEEFTAGIGGILPLQPGLHLVGTVGYGSVDIDTRGFDADDDGLFAKGGVRWMPNAQLELNGMLTYADFDRAGDDVSLTLGGLYNVTPYLAVGLDATFGDDVTAYTAGLRYYFPRR